MKENNKYYTPTIEEFHVGFEFESTYVLFKTSSDIDEWDKAVLTKESNEWFYDAYSNDAHPSEFRVKYLDKVDIESFGFKYSHSIMDGNLKIYFEKVPKGFTPRYQLHHNRRDNSLWIVQEGPSFTPLFNGYIKNKSEFKRLLKQLDINEK